MGKSNKVRQLALTNDAVFREWFPLTIFLVSMASLLTLYKHDETT